MKKSSLFKLAFRRARNNKKNIFFIILFTICSTLLLGIINFRMNYAKMMDDSFNKSIDFRILSVEPNNDFMNSDFLKIMEEQEKETGEDFVIEKMDLSILKYDQLLDIEHVVDGYWGKDESWTPRIGTKIEGIDEDVFISFINGSPKSLPDNIVGRMFEENERRAIVCPIEFDIYNDINRIQDGHDLLNKKVTVNYEVATWGEKGRVVERVESREYEIVGLYDSTSLMMEGNHCYVSGEEIKEIQESESVNHMGFNISYKIIVDSRKNVDYVKKEIAKLGYEVRDISYFDDATIESVNMLALLSSSLVIFVIIIISITYIRKKVINNSTDIGLLKAIGFSNKEVKLYNIYEIISLILISFLASIILINIIFLILKSTVLAIFYYYGYDIKLFIISYLLTIIVIIIIPVFIDALFVSSKIKKNIILLLKGENL